MQKCLFKKTSDDQAVETRRDHKINALTSYLAMTYDIDQDYNLWLQEQANLLRSRSFDELDLNNLIEEL